MRDHGQAGDRAAEAERAGVAHEDRSRNELNQRKPTQPPTRQADSNARSLACRCGGKRDRGGNQEDDRAAARGQPVEPVGEVHPVGRAASTEPHGSRAPGRRACRQRPDPACRDSSGTASRPATTSIAVSAWTTSFVPPETPSDRRLRSLVQVVREAEAAHDEAPCANRLAARVVRQDQERHAARPAASSRPSSACPLCFGGRRVPPRGCAGRTP